MIITAIVFAFVLYAVFGILTALYKRKEINEFAKILAPLLEKEMDSQQRMDLDMAGISVEQSTRWAGYLFCITRWPSAIHTNLVEAYHAAQEEKKNV